MQVGPHGNTANIVEVLHNALTTNEIGGGVFFDVGPAGVFVGLFQRIEHF